MATNIIAATCTLIAGSLSVSAASARPTVTPEEIAWLGEYDGRLVAVGGDGQVACVGLEGRRLGGFRIPDYQYDVHWIAIARQPAPVLAVATHGDIDNTIRLFSLPEGRPAGTVTVEQSPGLSLVRVSRDGCFLFCTSAVEGAVFGIDIRERRVAWRDNRSLVAVGVQVAPDGSALAVCSSDGWVECRHPNGEMIWRRQFSPRGDIVEPLWAGADSTLITLLDDETLDVTAADFGGGNIVWRKRVDRLIDLLAVSPDGKRQVFWERDGVWLYRLPEFEKGTRLSWADGLPDAFFTHDGQKLVLTPSLLFGPDGKARPDDRLTRQSRRVCVFDAQTGSLSASFELNLLEEQELPKGRRPQST